MVLLSSGCSAQSWCRGRLDRSIWQISLGITSDALGGLRGHDSIRIRALALKTATVRAPVDPGREVSPYVTCRSLGQGRADMGGAGLRKGHFESDEMDSIAAALQSGGRSFAELSTLGYSMPVLLHAYGYLKRKPGLCHLSALGYGFVRCDPLVGELLQSKLLGGFFIDRNTSIGRDGFGQVLAVHNANGERFAAKVSKNIGMLKNEYC